MPNGEKSCLCGAGASGNFLTHLQLANVRQETFIRDLASSQAARPADAGPPVGNIWIAQTNQDILLKHLQLANVRQAISNWYLASSQATTDRQYSNHAEKSGHFIETFARPEQMSYVGKAPLGREEIHTIEIPFRELDGPPDVGQGPLPC